MKALTLVILSFLRLALTDNGIFGDALMEQVMRSEEIEQQTMLSGCWKAKF